MSRIGLLLRIFLNLFIQVKQQFLTNDMPIFCKAFLSFLKFWNLQFILLITNNDNNWLIHNGKRDYVPHEDDRRVWLGLPCSTTEVNKSVGSNGTFCIVSAVFKGVQTPHTRFQLKPSFNERLNFKILVTGLYLF